MCSETSPRISFSHDLAQTDDASMEDKIPRRDTMLLASDSDFEFNISCSFEQESSSADELFANGMILPVQGRKVATQNRKNVQKCVPPPLPPLPHPSKIENSKKEITKEIIAVNSDMEEKPQSKSFWKFKRSSSLNCDIKKSLGCSFPLLSRSNSTGSAPNSKKLKQSSMSMARCSSSSSSASSSSSSTTQRPPLKKNNGVGGGGGGFYGTNGIKISPVLNVPPPYISRGTANLFGLGFLRRNVKDKKSKK